MSLNTTNGHHTAVLSVKEKRLVSNAGSVETTCALCVSSAAVASAQPSIHSNKSTVYEDNLYPPQNSAEAAERKRQREARDDLKRLGILP